jgi:uncharacterized protein
LNSLLISEINIYPVKSLGGISVKSSIVEERGLMYDRRWLLVDENGIFMTQRDFPQMALIDLSLSENNLIAKHKTNIDLQAIRIPLKFFSDERIEIIIWDDKCKAVPISKEYDNWFSDALKTKCRLVHMPDDERRIVEKKFVAEDKIVSFADAYPFLIIGQSSLDDLNSRMEVKLPMNRFRTNFVFSGGKPFDEDNWNDFMIGNVKFRAVKPCARCVITTTNQDTAERSSEPLRTLSTFRKFGNKVLFGMNLVADTTGVVNVGDEIKLG